MLLVLRNMRDLEPVLCNPSLFYWPMNQKSLRTTEEENIKYLAHEGLKCLSEFLLDLEHFRR